MLKKTLAAAGALLLAAGCSYMPSVSNPLALSGNPSEVSLELPAPAGTSPLLRNGQAISIAVADFTDARTTSRGRKLGDIKATVRDLYTTELALNQEISAGLTNAVRKQLAADGLRIAGTNEAADFRLSGIIKTFSLNIAGRDELSIVIEATLREGRNNDVIWSGVITEQDDRYAGVIGNSRATITSYLGEGVAAFNAKLSATVRDSLTKAYPHTIVASQTGNVSSTPGVTTLQAPTPRSESARAVSTQTPATTAAPIPATTSVASPASVAAKATPQAAAATLGEISVTSTPARAKVYVDDVYYGLTPLKLELPIGVTQLSVKMDGYKPMTEKVAVRRGMTTEWEVRLQK